MKTVAMSVMIGVFIVTGIILLIYDRKNTNVKKLILIGVMTGMAVVGRFIFAPFPGFKPVTAIVVIAGIYLGTEAGFYCGALTPLITNFYFGQGPWTPFQMFIWGMTGIVAALLSNQLKNNKIVIIVFGVISGTIFSLFMDVYSVVWLTGGWNWPTYFLMIASSLPFTVIYAISNVVFLLVLMKPIGEKLKRIIVKYQIS